ncbi:MAG TPA: DNA gyrase C-terminal beta-propeller domain-containing protein, partial [Longimicrobiaceae bacterium]
TREGMAIRFNEDNVREMGRATTGVRGISLQDGDEVIGMVVMKAGNTLLVVTEKGMGKRTGIDAYRQQRRGGRGVINVKTNDKTGRVVAIREVRPGDELMVITREGIVNRQSVDGIRVIGRNTQGVRLINLSAKDVVMDVARVVKEDEIPESPESPDSGDGNGSGSGGAYVEVLAIADGEEPEDELGLDGEEEEEVALDGSEIED